MRFVSKKYLLLASGVMTLAGQPLMAQTTTTPPAATAPSTMPQTPSATMPATGTQGTMAPSGSMPSATAPAATATATPTVGMMVKDAAGGMVGTVTAVSDGFVTVKTDKHEAKLPAASFAPSNGALVYGMTQAQLDTQIETQTAAAAAQFKAGAMVKGSDGAQVATVTAVDADTVTLKLTSGKSVRVPRNGLAGSADGLVIGMTAAQLDAAAGPATTKSSTTTTTKTKTKSK